MNQSSQSLIRLRILKHLNTEAWDKAKKLAVLLIAESEYAFDLERKAFENLISILSEKIESYYYIMSDEDQLLDPSFEDFQLPLVAVYRGSHVILAIDGDKKFEKLENALSKIHTHTSHSEKATSWSKKTSNRTDSAINTTGNKLLGYLLSQAKISGKTNLNNNNVLTVETRKRILFPQMPIT